MADILAQAVQYHQAGQLPQAERLYRQILQANPRDGNALHLLGLIAQERGQYQAAVDLIRQAVAVLPQVAEFHCNLANAYISLENWEAAAASGRQALRLRPDLPEGYACTGDALTGQEKWQEAIACYRQALALRATYAEAHHKIGVALAELGQVDEAVAALREALRLRPDLSEIHINLASLLKDQGLMPESIASYRRAVELDSTNAAMHSNLVYVLPFCSDYDAATIAAHLRGWNQQHAAGLAGASLPHGNTRVPDRRLRVGYVSPDFRMHPVGRFVLPLLEGHQHDRFEIFGYASVRSPDEMTGRCRAACAVWREVLELTDEQLAQLIRQDAIDILVDLTMHLADNRLLVFARKPAPVQVTYLAYPGSSGLAAIDYRLSDPYLDPPGDPDELLYAEKTIRLPETYWCYRPPFETGAVGDLPADRAGHLTLGCLNNFCKVSEPALLAWTRILQALPTARLLLSARPGSHRERVRRLLAQQQVAPERLSFADRLSLADYFRVHQDIDLALDPFPHAGGTTTCDALWMGVPVVSLRGQTIVGRSGWSILSNAGLANLVACDDSEYIERAIALASDRPRLRTLRRTMRERLAGSPLMDAPRFVRHVEAAYRQMWQTWCDAPASGRR